MNLDVTSKVVGYDGQPIKQDGTNEDLTWKQVIFTALNSMDSEEPMPPEDKVKSYDLTMRAFTGDSPEFKTEEMAYIISRIKKIYSPLVCGRAEEFFSPKPKQ